MSDLGTMGGADEGQFVLVFRPPENPAAQVANPQPFKGLRLKLEELLEWFKDLHVESIELWIEGGRKSGNVTELFLSHEGKTGAKITIRPHVKDGSAGQIPASLEDSFSLEPLEKALPDEAPSQNMPVAKPETSDPTVRAFFSPIGGIEGEILDMIDKAVQSVSMAAYAFTNQKIERALLDAVQRGVKVTLVMDETETKGSQAKVHDELEKGGVSIRLISPSGGIMHDKFIITDGKNLEWGSYNYTDRAESTNYENATFSSDNSLAQSYLSNFDSIYNLAKAEVQGMKRPIRRFLRRISSPFKRRI